MQMTIRNNEPQGSPKRLAVLVVTAGAVTDQERRHTLAPGQEVAVEVNAGQFVMADEKED
ncbi:hypothetical protein [Pelomonas aquatica]|jgi:hypothetical protein|uniref:Uncharacterized protein n=1 Tax=Pelomonas aquatica TaxID=431058 RepID=A0A9X4LJQ6_9BURK|nr:hypothetical protein [Pelomonas aquatica]MCY4753257.1 hypothetical protein [Pelomonas aquatica]MDG0861338.1 hypothetical protein [Pelomonas aquatica]